MKKILFFASALTGLFLAASCQQENLEPVGGNTVTYTVQVPEAISTKALIGEDVAAVTQLIYEVYRTEAETADDHSKAELRLYQKEATLTDGEAKVELELVNNQNFRVLFWAQVPNNGVYTTTDLKNVTLSQDLAANAENYNAFAGADYIKYGDNLAGRTITLVRPIAQLNIATTPESLVLGEGGTGQTTVAVKTSEVIVDGLSTTYNVSEAKAGADAVKFEYSATDPAALTQQTLTVNGKDYQYLSMNYVGFAAAAGSNVTVDYDIVTENVGTVSNIINNVPVKANYRTNIVGNLITSMSDYTVTLDKEWAGVAEEVEIWDGKFLSQPAYDNVTKTWSVKKASELAWLAAAVNGEVAVTRAGGDSFAGETVKLTADIDLGNHPWTPIGLTGDQAGFQGTFDGNGKTISNLYIDQTAEPKYQSAGLFGSARYATIKALTIKNATIKNLDVADDSSNGAAVVVGSAQFASTIDNVHVVNAVVTSNRRAAGIAGYFVGTIQNCSVDGLTATATPDDYDGDGKHSNGDKVGGVLATTNGATVLKNNVVKNANIKGYRNLGGLAGAANLGENSSNKVENTVVTVDRTYTMVENDAALSGPIVGRILGGTLDDSNVATDVVVVSTEEDVETPDSFAEALANVADGGVVAVAGEISATSLDAAGKNITIVGTTEDATIDASSQVRAAVTKGNITFKNLTFKFSPANVHYNSGFDADNGTLVFENCKFEGLATADGSIIYNNCQFTNTTEGKYAAWVYAGNVVYNNCSFKGVDRAVKVYGGSSLIKATYNDCTFEAAKENDPADPNKAGVEVTVKDYPSTLAVDINNPTIINTASAEHYGNEYFNIEAAPNKGNGIVTLDGHTYAQLADGTALSQVLKMESKSVTANLQNDVTVAGGTVAYAGANTEVVAVNGNGKKLTFTDSYRTYVKNAGGKFVLNNVNIVRSTTSTSTHFYDYNISFTDVELNDVTLDRGINVDGNVVMNNVSIEQKNVDTYAMFVFVGSDLQMDRCNITTADDKGRGIKVTNEDRKSSTATTSISVKNTSFDTYKKAAILVMSHTATDIVLDNVDITNVAADSVNPVWVDEAGAAYYDLVTVTGGTKIQE